MTQAALAPNSVPDNNPGRAVFGLRTGKVTGSDWRDHTIDVTMSDGTVYLHVNIIEMWGGTDYGDWWHPQYLEQAPGDSSTAPRNVDSSPGNFDDTTSLPTKRRDAYALLAFVEGYASLPVCIGFWYPEVSQMMFSGLQRLTRHVGDTFAAVSQDGTHYLAFNKDGTAISFNTGDPRPPIVRQTDYDKLSNPLIGGHNITLYVQSAESKIELNGTDGTITILAGGTGEIDITGSGPVTITGSPLTLNGLVGLYF
jgi:hypothetical protein